MAIETVPLSSLTTKKNKKKSGIKSKDRDHQEENLEGNVLGKEQSPSKAVASNVGNDNEEKVIPMEKSIFSMLDAVVTKDPIAMKDAITKVIQFLSQMKEDKQQKHIDYVTKRCVRSCGGERIVTRTGFSACLTALLKFFGNKIPLKQLYQLIEKELIEGQSNQNINGVTGQILVCSSIIRSGRLGNDSTEVKQFTDILINTTHLRGYQARMAYTTLKEGFELVSPEIFKNAMWEPLKKELLKPWPKQTVNTIDALIFIKGKFPDVMTADVVNKYWCDSDLLNSKSFNDLYRIFFKETCTRNEPPETIDTFISHIANSNNLVEFWKNNVEANLQTAKKLEQNFVFRALQIVFENQSTPDWSNFLTTNFMKMFFDCLKRQQKESKNKNYMPYLDDFTDSLVRVCEKLKTDDQKLKLMHCLIKPPYGMFNIEKYTKTRIIYQMINLLSEDGVKSLYDYCHCVFTGYPSIPLADNESYDTADRFKASDMLHALLMHKAVQDSVEWRSEKLCSLFKCGIFNLNTELSVCKKDEASEFSQTMSRKCRTLFFTSHKLNKSSIKLDKDLMDRIINKLNLLLTKHKKQDKFIFKNSFDETTKNVWTQMKTFLDSLKNDEEVPTALIVLLQHLLIQLFNEPKVELSTINDLSECIKLQQNGNGTDSTEKLPWTHVLVDISVHLLSLNIKLLRDLVTMVFNNMSKYFDINALHYVLSLLNMKDGQNPLINQIDEDSDNDESDNDSADNSNKELQRNNDEIDSNESNDEDDDNEDDTGPNHDSKDEGGEDGDEDEDEDDESDSDNDDETDFMDDDDEEDETVTEVQVLRNDLSQVLMENGAMPMAEDDADSVDLNDLDEEQGRKLDEAIAAVFRARSKSSSANPSNNQKKSKNYRSMKTTTMHFRLRVLDLVQIISEHRKDSLTIATTIMQSLYEMLQYCTSNEEKPLQQKTEKLLIKVTSCTNYPIVKSNNNDNGNHEAFEWNQSEMVTLIEQLVRTPILIKDHEIANRLLSNCFIFLILNGSRLPEKKKEKNILSLCLEYIEEYINKRSSKLNYTVFAELFKSRWTGIWELAKTLAVKGIQNQTRIYRRIQAFKLLILLYNKKSFSEFTNDTLKINLRDVEKPIYSHITELAKSNSTIKTTGKEVDGLFELIVTIERSYKNVLSNSCTSSLCTKKTPELMEMVRKRVHLNTMNNYKNYCSIHKLKVLHNSDIPKPEINGGEDEHDGEDEIEDKKNGADGDVEVPKKHEKINKLKRKMSNNENIDDTNVKNESSSHKISAKRQKKLKKEERLSAASRGLNGHFYQQQVDDADDGDNAD